MSGAGWSLKSGELNLSELVFDDTFTKILKMKSTTIYKFFLLKFIFGSIEKENERIYFKDFYKFILDEFYKIYSIYKSEINLKNKKSLLYMLLKEKNIETKDDLYKINIAELNFLENYVFGALYSDTEGKCFGFSKKDKSIIVNLNLKNNITENIIKKLEIKIIQELGLVIDGYFIKKEREEPQMEITEDIKEEKGNYYQQKFSLEIDYILNNLLKTKDEICFFSNLEKLSRQEMADDLGIGLAKLTTQLQYMKFLNLFDGTKKTTFGEKISKMNSNHDYIEPLLYYYLTKNKNDGGHYIYSELINEVIYKLFNDNFEFKINYSKLFAKMEELNINNLDSKSWKTMVNFAISCITNSETGFGKMGLLEEIESDKKNPMYEIHSYWVEPLVGAYIIYDSWKDGQTAMPINSIINDKYNLGRMFLMDQDAVIETLEEIKALGLIDINLTAGLNQVVKSSRYTKEDILDMMIKNS
ncbi:MAG: DUF4007 family protein [Cetobacterium sp.]